MSQPTSRQELYDRIRESSKDAVILEEMIRLGFWPAAGELPEDPADEIRRRGELEGQLRALRTEQSRLRNIEALKKEARKRRLAESRRKRQETKERRLREREERAAAWAQRKQSELPYLGEGVSGGLGETERDADKIARYGVPELKDAMALARALGLSLGRLRQLTFSRTTSRTSNYVRFTIPKRSGGERKISAPIPELKDAQRWVLENVLDKVELHRAAHGFRKGRSIVSNAKEHVGRAVLVNVDLENFFPTVSYRRVKGLFRSFGYSEQVAIVLALLCTEAEATELTLDGARYFVGLGPRVLPQGSPASPAVTNIICRGLDARLTKVAEDLGFAYTRYADDLSFSSAQADANVGRLLRQVGRVVNDEGFAVHPDKTRVLRRDRQQEVTGIVVNDVPNVSREQLRRFRATLHHIEKDGPAGKRWGRVGPDGDVIAAIEGFANYVAMVNPDKGAPLVARVRALVERHGKKPTPPRGGGKKKRRRGADEAPADQPAATPSSDEAVEAPAADDAGDGDKKKKKKKWWKLF